MLKNILHKFCHISDALGGCCIWYQIKKNIKLNILDKFLTNSLGPILEGGNTSLQQVGQDTHVPIYH